MSINVTVTGNPVSIKRGKMVTADSDHSKHEFDKRRRMRLEQVRQQSKDIAEDVRKKVRKEKKKQLSNVEKEGAQKLKEWQNRKLLELQEQYCECLKDIGLGHTQGAIENIQEESIDVRRQELKEKARERGERAAQKLQIEKNQDNLKKAIPLQHKKFVRDVEDTRSAMISKLTPSKKKKKKAASANINISNVVSESDSELEVTVPTSIDTSNAESSRSPSRLSSGDRSKSPRSVTRTTNSSVSQSNSPKRTKAVNVKIAPSKDVKRVRSRSRSGSPKKTKPCLKSISEDPSIKDKFPNFPLDTRISDRIKNRHLPPEETFPNFHSKRQPIVVNIPCPRANASERTNTDISVPPEAEFSNFNYKKRPIEENKSRAYTEINKTDAYFNPQAQSSGTDCQCQKDKNDNIPPTALNLNQDKLVSKRCTRKTCSVKKPSSAIDEIPAKPTVSLRNVRHEPQNEVELNTVQYYDHSNRYSKEYICDNSCVRKIPEASIQICPSPCNEKEFYDKVYKRDREAQLRGQKALEKERIHKDYKELMQQLPVLQRQERIASIKTDNPIFHMSDDRLREYELKKQNRMDQAYEKLFPDTPMITIPPKNHQIETELFNVVDLRGDNPSLNLAAWDVHSNQKQQETCAKEHCGASSDKAADEKRDKLKALLAKLKMQKEMLLREVDELPKDSNLNNLIDELDRLNREESKEKLIKKDSSNTSISKKDCNCPKTAPCPCTHYTKTPRKLDKKLNQKRPRQKILSTSNSSSSPSPRKKHRHRRRTLILQNTSTQTTPKVNSEPNVPCEISSTSDVRPKPVQKRSQSKSPKRKASSEKITRSTSPIRLKSRTTSPTDDNKSKRSKSPVQVCTAAVDNKLKRSKSPTKEKPKRDDKVPLKARPCDCKDAGQSDVCEILIKIKDDDAPPEITVKSPTKAKKFVTVKTDIQKSTEELRKPEKAKQKLISKIKSSEKPSKTSWREQFSRNDSAGTSTSTSYFSPPDFLQSGEFVRPRAESTSDHIKSHLSHLLTTRSKQSNIDASQKNLDPRLLRYMKKLLLMSRASIDDLGVSTVSDISTPSSSIMDTDKNNPLHQLKNVIKFFNLNPDDLRRCLNYSDETDTSLQRNTTSSTMSSYEASKSKNQTDPSHSQLGSNPCQNVATEPYDDDTYPQAVTKYTKIAEMCHKRISDLTAMIEKVRVEKQQIMSPNQSDKDNTTTYLNLPSNLGVHSMDTNDFNSKSDNSDTNAKKSHDKTSESSNTEQSELDRKLLEIDYSLAAKLQKMTPAEIKTQYKHRMDALNDQCNADDPLNVDLVKRYKALLRLDDVSSNEDSGNISNPEKSPAIETNNETDKLVPSRDAVLKSPDLENNIPFVPLLIDIPRLPKLPSGLDSNRVINQLDNSRQRKPPLAKGLNAAKKFNDQIKTTPHELSTILEVDSQLSTRLRQSNSPEMISKRTSPAKAFTQMKPLVVIPPDQNNIWTSQPTETPPTKISDESMPDIVSELPGDKTSDSNGVAGAASKHIEISKESISKDKGDIIIEETNNSQLNVYNLSRILAEQSPDTSSDKSELENVEMMLKSMGMGWAIATIRKTQQALDRPSSSGSSLEKSVKQREVQISDNSSGTDVTLRDFLTRRVLNTSTSTSKSDVSPFIKEFDDISTIQGSGLSSENKNQRTSTPIQTTKSTEKSKNDSHKVLTPESDQSSKVNFLTMPEDTTSSLGSKTPSES